MSHRAQLKLFAAAPATRPAVLPKGARWRTVSTPSQPIGFILQRSRRRSIGFVIDDTGLRVTAPVWATLGQIDAAVITRSRWIIEKLQQRQQHLEHLATADTLWKNDGRIPYLGSHIHIQLDATQRGATFHGIPDQPRAGDKLSLPLPQSADHTRIQDSVHAWLQQQAKWWFSQRLDHFITLSGHTLRSWRLSSATTRWGSCSSAGRIMLNWRLIHFKHSLIDYVIAHEVAHLSEMNHSQAFWRELERLMPDFAPARLELKRHQPGVLPLV